MNTYLRELTDKIFRKKIEEVNRRRNKFSSLYYRETKDLKENLLFFQEATERIKAKYKPDSFEYLFQREFGEQFSGTDFLYSERVTAYCERNSVTVEQMSALEKKASANMNKVSKNISEEIELARCYVHIRDGSNSYRLLIRAAELEKKYGSTEIAEKFRKRARILKRDEKKGAERNNESAKLTVLGTSMNSIKNNIDPYIGKQPEYQENWLKSIESLEKELSLKGIDLNEDGHNLEISEVWRNICHQRSNERVAWMYYRGRDNQGDNENERVIILEKAGKIIHVGRNCNEEGKSHGESEKSNQEHVR